VVKRRRAENLDALIAAERQQMGALQRGDAASLPEAVQEQLGHELSGGSQQQGPYLPWEREAPGLYPGTSGILT